MMSSSNLKLNPNDMEEPVLSPHMLSAGEDTSSSSSSNSPSQHGESPRNDWMLPGSIWTQLSDPKPQTLDANLNVNLNFSPSLSQQHWSSIDMDSDISAFMTDSLHQFSLDPNSLNLEETNQEQIPPSENYDTMFQFTLSQPPDAKPGLIPSFQLPTPTPGSMSSRSVSPASSKLDSDSSAGVNPNDLNLFSQLGHKARDAAGVTLAVPMNRDSRMATEGQPPVTPVSPIHLVPQSKVPIPRLRPAAAAPPKPQILMAPQPTPPSSQHGLSPPSASQDNILIATTTKTGRPKTSHTTIERRYRTNLNARILALRRAVPALRILEKNTTTQTQGKGLTGATAPRWDFDDVVNERGYVDGVKAARKNSKGVVLGKAVEYIKALKRREMRLKREAEGLRSLLLSLVGGPELLREWEKEWQERFGGEEADEVDEDVDDNEEGDGEADDGDDAEDGDSDEDNARAKKRARIEKERKQKVTPAPPTEKRKRGRPRKNPVPDTPIVPQPHLMLQPPAIAAQRQPSNYLLAAFLLFNFFNPTTPASKPSETHEGTVLSHLSNTTSASLVVESTGWSVLYATNLLVSVLLLLSLLEPYIPKKVARLLPDTLLINSSSPSTSPTGEQETVIHHAPTRDVKISRALASGDERALRNALGADGSLYSVLKVMTLLALGRGKRILRTQRTAEEIVMSHDEAELRGWRRMSQIEVLRAATGENKALYGIQAYLSFSFKLPPSTSPSDNITLALLAHHLAIPSATRHWESARHSDIKTSLEALVSEMELEDAARIISITQSPLPLTDPLNEDSFSPVHFIAAHVILARTKTLAARLFVFSVSGQRLVNLDKETNEGNAASVFHNNDEKTVIKAGREFGGPLGELTQLLDKVDRCPTAEVLATLPAQFYIDHDGREARSLDSDTEDDQESGDAQFKDVVKDTRLLLLATLLYRRLFPIEDASTKHVPSPPPSPTLKSAKLPLALRRILASTVFDADPDTEDARDQVVDLLAETKRRSRSGGLY